MSYATLDVEHETRPSPDSESKSECDVDAGTRKTYQAMISKMVSCFITIM